MVIAPGMLVCVGTVGGAHGFVQHHAHRETYFFQPGTFGFAIARQGVLIVTLMPLDDGTRIVNFHCTDLRAVI